VSPGPAEYVRGFDGPSAGRILEQAIAQYPEYAAGGGAYETSSNAFWSVFAFAHVVGKNPGSAPIRTLGFFPIGTMDASFTSTGVSTVFSFDDSFDAAFFRSALVEWLSGLLPPGDAESGSDDEGDTAERLRGIQRKVERLVSTLTLYIDANERLRGEVADRDLELDQLIAQRDALLAELHKTRFNPKRASLFIQASIAVGTAIMAAGTWAGAVRPTSKPQTTINYVIEQCNETLTFMGDNPMVVPVRKREQRAGLRPGEVADGEVGFE
jgi:hypothetical protein